MSIAPATTVIQPPSVLLTWTTNPLTNGPNPAFPLQTNAWLAMQNVVQMAVSFPLSAEDFTDLYGAFADEGSVEQAVAVLGSIQQTAQQYGDPTTLISSLPTFEQAATAPASIYANAVWLAAQTQSAAQQIEGMLSQGLTDIGTITDPPTRLADLTALLTGPGGVNAVAATLQGYISSFETAVTAFYSELNAELTGPTGSLSAYLGQAANVLAAAEAALAADASTVSQLTSSIKQLNDEYIGFTVAASASPVFLLVPFFGIVLAAADAATFGVLATQVQQRLAAAQAALSSVDTDLQCKGALVATLSTFNAIAADVAKDGGTFLGAIATLSGGWTEFASEINTWVGALTVDDLADWGTFMTTLGFQDALAGWQLIASTAETFFQTGVVQFSPSPAS